MQMDFSHWMALESAMHSDQPRRAFTWETVRRIATFARPHRRALVAFVLLSTAIAVLAVATPILAGRVVDEITGDGSGRTVVLLGLAIAGVALVDAVVSIAERWQSAKIGESIILDLRRAVFAHVQRMPVAFFTRTRTGALVSRLNNDVIGAQRAFTWTLSGVVSNLITLLLTLVVMVSLSWQITLLSLLLLPVFVIPARRMGTRLAVLEREAADHDAAMLDQMTERFSAPGATLVKLFGRPHHEEDAFGTRAERVAEIGVRTAMGQYVFLTALALVSALALALVYGLGGWLALDGRLEAGTIVTLGLLLAQLYAPLTALSSARVDAMTALVSFERVFEVLDLEPLVAEREDPEEVPAGPASVQLDGVHFAYPTAEKVSIASLEEVSSLDTRGGEPVLEDVSFTAEPGQVVALVGSSGSGKSTIASLVPRLYDVDGGTVRVGGVDVRDLSFESLRRTVGMVTQEGHLFHETLAENLRFARPGATDEELWDALRRVRLEQLVRSLPAGLETVVGERGYRFSGGERQRLTIARILLAEPRVVILDEATAHLDTTSEADVQAALDEALTGRTALVIAHRLSTIREADLILVVEAGRIVERGTHAELLALGGRYAELHRTQFQEQAPSNERPPADEPALAQRAVPWLGPTVDAPATT